MILTGFAMRANARKREKIKGNVSFLKMYNMHKCPKLHLSNTL